MAGFPGFRLKGIEVRHVPMIGASSWVATDPDGIQVARGQVGQRTQWFGERDEIAKVLAGTSVYDGLMKEATKRGFSMG